MDGTAVKAVAELAARADATMITIEGVHYSTCKLHDMRMAEPQVTPLKLTSLVGFAAYIDSQRAELPDKGALCVVAGPRDVQLVGPLSADVFRTRQGYARAATEDVLEEAGFLFGKFCEQESFVIAVTTLFEETIDRARLLALAGNVRGDAVRTDLDDGVTQNVTVRRGSHLGTDATIVNPFVLTPFRTFLEVDQPSSPFLLRVRASEGEAAKLALFETDGGRWKHAARYRLGAWLASALQGHEGITVLA